MPNFHWRADICIFHAQAKAFHLAHSGAVQQLRNATFHTRYRRKQPLNFGPAQHYRQPRGSLRPTYFVHPWQINIQNMLVEKKQRSEGLLVRRGRRRPHICQVRQKCFDIRTFELARMAQPMKPDEIPNPVCI